jgi:hypothetical protein
VNAAGGPSGWLVVGATLDVLGVKTPAGPTE